MGQDDWEVLELGQVPGSNLPDPEYEDEDGNCCSITLQIEIGSLIDANYFACPSPSPEYFPPEVESAQGSRVQISEDDENKYNDKNDAKSLDSKAPLEAGHGVPYVIEGLCIIRPLTAPEGAMLRADSEFSGRAGEFPEGDFAEKGQVICRNDSMSKNNNNNNNNNSCGGLEGKRKGKMNLLSFLRVWRRRMGMLPSFGVAAAVMGLMILGRRIYGGKLGRSRRQQQLIRFQIYGDNKRISRLMTEAARLNEAFSGVTGAAVGAGLVPVVTAQISFGGYCDGL